MDDNDIRDFLLENPGYFQQNPDLLGLLQIPHASGAAVSLVEKQVSVLRERNVNLRHQIRDIGSTARENDQLFADTRELVLALLENDSVSGLQQALMSVLKDSFGIEHADLTLFEEHLGAHDGNRRMPAQDFRDGVGPLLAKNTAACGPLRAEEFAFLFPGKRIVGSAAVALLMLDGKALGALAIGSTDTGRYDSNTGTLFLEFVAEVLVRLLTRAT